MHKNEFYAVKADWNFILFVLYWWLAIITIYRQKIIIDGVHRKTAMRAEKSRYFVRNIEEDIMYKILKAEKLNEIVYLMVVELSLIHI